jgi:hypothetical protein
MLNTVNTIKENDLKASIWDKNVTIEELKTQKTHDYLREKYLKKVNF